MLTKQAAGLARCGIWSVVCPSLQPYLQLSSTYLFESLGLALLPELPNDHADAAQGPEPTLSRTLVVDLHLFPGEDSDSSPVSRDPN